MGAFREDSYINYETVLKAKPKFYIYNNINGRFIRF